MIKAIIFDCFGVLATDVWLAFCDSLPASANVGRARELNRAYDAGLISHAEFFDQVEEATGQRPPDLEDLNSGELAKNTALIDYISELKPRFHIGLLSNISSDWITRKLLSPTEAALFDEMVLSYQIGMIKPDPRVYELVCERLGVELSEAIMIDDRADYVAAAKAIGLQGITYTDFVNMKLELQTLLDANN